MLELGCRNVNLLPNWELNVGLGLSSCLSWAGVERGKRLVHNRHCFTLDGLDPVPHTTQTNKEITKILLVLHILHIFVIFSYLCSSRCADPVLN